MPKAHRDILEESGVKELIVTAAPAKCLCVYAKDEWLELEKKIMAMPNAKHKGIQRIQRLYLGYASPVELDGTGRMMLTAEQRAFAGIERKAHFVGQGTRFEIWDEARWDREFGLSDDDDIDFSDVPDELMNLSL